MFKQLFVGKGPFKNKFVFFWIILLIMPVVLVSILLLPSKELGYSSNVDDGISTIDNQYYEEEGISKDFLMKRILTESVSENNVPEEFDIDCGSIKVSNQSDIEITDEICKLSNLNKGKKVLIYHTHTSESYTTSSNYEMSGNYRTIDDNYNMIRVGNELEKYLIDKGFLVIHDTKYYDYPKYNGAYQRSLVTVQDILKENSDIDFVLDLHRDAIGDGSSYGPSVKINNESVAQLMIVVGTDANGDEHLYWRNNLNTALSISNMGNKMYSGLFRPVVLRNSRFNQHLSDGALILEVGATDNTLDEVLLSMKYLANVLEEIVNN